MGALTALIPSGSQMGSVVNLRNITSLYCVQSGATHFLVLATNVSSFTLPFDTEAECEAALLVWRQKIEDSK